MTAKELIDKLSEFPPDTTVCSMQHIAMEVQKVTTMKGSFFTSDNQIKNECVIVLY